MPLCASIEHFVRQIRLCHLRSLQSSNPPEAPSVLPDAGLIGIGGWLGLLIVRLWIGTVLRVLEGLGDGFGAGMTGLGLFCICSAVLSAAAAFLLGIKHPKGVIVAKVYLALDACLYAVELIFGSSEIANQTNAGFPYWFKPSGFLAACILWIAYLSLSKRVRNTYFPRSAPTNVEDRALPDVARS
jgi:hypothetical protein